MAKYRDAHLWPRLAEVTDLNGQRWQLSVREVMVISEGEFGTKISYSNGFGLLVRETYDEVQRRLGWEPVED